jgi:hypothetical protein
VAEAAAAAAVMATKPVAAATTLNYAGEASAVGLSAAVRATPLVIPNLIAVCLLFMPLHSGGPPVDSVINYARLLVRLRGQPGGGATWEALITGPFLLAIPLGVWTLRLAVAPRPRDVERTIAWSLTLTSIVMTLLCVAYCAWLGQRRFILPIAATLAVLGLAVACLSRLWPIRRAWPVALLAMTAAWAANTTLTSLVVVSHQTWRAGSVIGLLVVIAQLGMMIVCVVRWRGAAPVVIPG